MKYVVALCIAFFVTSTVSAADNNHQGNPNYDPKLAAKLGADDYGMKPYVLVMLKTGSNDSTDKETMNHAFAGHMANIKRLVSLDKLIVAGPIAKNDNAYRGIFILNAANLEEAQELLQSDPAIKANYLQAELYNWYGSAALAEYLPASDKIWKLSPLGKFLILLKAVLTRPFLKGP